MYDYEFVFAKTLQQKIIDQVWAGVKTWVSGDELYVSIMRDENDINFVTSIPGFSERILNGWTTDYAAYEVIKKYKAYITKMIFK